MPDTLRGREIKKMNGMTLLNATAAKRQTYLSSSTIKLTRLSIASKKAPYVALAKFSASSQVSFNSLTQNSESTATSLDLDA
jgi:hypothetical protein